MLMCGMGIMQLHCLEYDSNGAFADMCNTLLPIISLQLPSGVPCASLRHYTRGRLVLLTM